MYWIYPLFFIKFHAFQSLYNKTSNLNGHQLIIHWNNRVLIAFLPTMLLFYFWHSNMLLTAVMSGGEFLVNDQHLPGVTWIFLHKYSKYQLENLVFANNTYLGYYSLNVATYLHSWASSKNKNKINLLCLPAWYSIKFPHDRKWK